MEVLCLVLGKQGHNQGPVISGLVTTSQRKAHEQVDTKSIEIGKIAVITMMMKLALLLRSLLSMATVTTVSDRVLPIHQVLSYVLYLIVSYDLYNNFCGQSSCYLCFRDEHTETQMHTTSQWRSQNLHAGLPNCKAHNPKPWQRFEQGKMEVEMEKQLTLLGMLGQGRVGKRIRKDFKQEVTLFGYSPLQKTVSQKTKKNVWCTFLQQSF